MLDENILFWAKHNYLFGLIFSFFLEENFKKFFGSIWSNSASDFQATDQDFPCQMVNCILNLK